MEQELSRSLSPCSARLFRAQPEVSCLAPLNTRVLPAMSNPPRAQASPTQALTPERLRQAYGAFATGVAVVTTNRPEGQPVGMTVSSFSAVSLQPPLVLWCLQRQVPPADAFEQAGHYALHFLHAGQQALSDRFANPATLATRFEGLAWSTGLAGLPLLADCPTRLCCEVVQRIEAGDHLVLLGQVLSIEHESARPLVYHGGRYLS